MNIKRIETFVIVAIIAVIGVIYAFSQTPVGPVPLNTDRQTQEQAPASNEQNPASESAVSYQGQDGRTAMELLRANHEVETSDFAGIGEFVVAIDGQASESGVNFWAFYVNGSQSQVGASQYVTQDGDVIEWKLEEIQ